MAVLGRWARAWTAWDYATASPGFGTERSIIVAVASRWLQADKDALLCADPFLSHAADTFRDMEAQHIGPLLGSQLFLAPVAYIIWAVSAATYRIVLDHSHRLRRAVLRWRQKSVTVDSWFWFGTTWAAMNVGVYMLVTGVL